MKYIKENYNYLLFSFFFISIIAWVLEMGYSLVVRNKFVVPGAWYGPYCPIYGLTFLLLLGVFRKKDNIILNILKIAVTVTVMEYFISFVSGEIFNNVIWDYSNKMVNLNGRVCLEMSTIFTIMGSLMMYIFVPTTKKIYLRFKDYIKYSNIIFSVGMFIDIVITLIK